MHRIALLVVLAFALRAFRLARGRSAERTAAASRGYSAKRGKASRPG